MGCKSKHWVFECGPRAGCGGWCRSDEITLPERPRPFRVLTGSAHARKIVQPRCSPPDSGQTGRITPALKRDPHVFSRRFPASATIGRQELPRFARHLGSALYSVRPRIPGPLSGQERSPPDLGRDLPPYMPVFGQDAIAGRGGEARKERCSRFRGSERSKRSEGGRRSAGLAGPNRRVLLRREVQTAAVRHRRRRTGTGGLLRRTRRAGMGRSPIPPLRSLAPATECSKEARKRCSPPRSADCRRAGGADHTTRGPLLCVRDHGSFSTAGLPSGLREVRNELQHLAVSDRRFRAGGWSRSRAITFQEHSRDCSNRLLSSW